MSAVCVRACVVSGRPSPTEKKKTLKTIENDDRSTVYHTHFTCIIMVPMLGMTGVREKNQHRDYNTS